ncbi:hypothetical protein AB0H00_28275 [Nocardia sp. NPDC023852]|uniref:WXG100 family type VII secretion target n=1 Tax=Nocardia sp. NPDC023852 TaxID=3154697 RepID=UPI0033C69CAF
MRKMPRAAERATHRRTDPAYAPNVEIFDNLTHAEIHAEVQLLNPAVLAGGEQAWADSAAGLADAIFQAHTEIRAAIADGWRGGAAESAVAVVRVFEQSGQDLADVLAVVSQRLGQASDAAEALRAAVSEPSGVTPDLAAALLDPTQATSNIDGQKEGEHARQDVVRAMNDIYAGVFIRTGTDVPAFPDEADDVAPGAPAAEVTGTSPKALDGRFSSLHMPAQGTKSAGSSADGAPTDQTPAAAPATTTAGATPTDTVVRADTPTNAPRVASVAAEAPQSVIPAGTRLRAAPATSTPAPTTTAAATPAPIVVSTTPGTSNLVPAEERKRDERRTDNAGNDTVTGLGAGAVGGLMGGALATTDTPRPGSSVAANAVGARTVHVDDEDDEFDLDDLPTYLEPSDDGGELIGSLDPTTPPVLGEWTEYE